MSLSPLSQGQDHRFTSWFTEHIHSVSDTVMVFLFLEEFQCHDKAAMDMEMGPLIYCSNSGVQCAQV